MALATLSAEGEDIERALAELASVYSWFKEGFETPDLMEARALLEAHRQTA